MNFFLSAITISLCCTNADAFCSTKVVHTTHAVPKTIVHLLPSQGCQLAAASAAALAKEEIEKNSTTDQEERATPTNAAREFALRLFNLPSQIMNSPSESINLSLPFPVASETEEDVVVYPIVGFTFVKFENDKMRVVPSSNARGECNINNFQKSRTEPTYGWFSPCCKLGDLHSEDHAEYCGGKGDYDNMEVKTR